MRSKSTTRESMASIIRDIYIIYDKLLVQDNGHQNVQFQHQFKIKLDSNECFSKTTLFCKP